MNGRIEYYPILINGVAYNVTVRSQRTQFTADGTFRAIPNTIALSFENQGVTNVTLDRVFLMTPGSPAYNLGGDLFGRRDDEIDFAFAGGAGTLIVTQDIFVRLVKLEGI